MTFRCDLLTCQHPSLQSLNRGEKSISSLKRLHIGTVICNAVLGSCLTFSNNKPEIIGEKILDFIMQDKLEFSEGLTMVS